MEAPFWQRPAGSPELFAGLDGEVYTSVVHSFTYGKDYQITLSKKYLGPDDTVLLVDDFLAVGKAMRGMLDICSQAGAKVAALDLNEEAVKKLVME